MVHCIIDIESTGLNRFKNNISIFGYYIPEYDYYEQVYDFNITAQVDPKYSANNIRNLDKIDYSGLYKRIEESIGALPKKADGSFDVVFIFQNGKFDSLFIQEKTGILLSLDEDVMILQYCLHMGSRKSLDFIAKQELGIDTWDIPLKEKFVATEKSLAYHKEDLLNTWLCYKSLKAKVEANPTIKKLYDKLAMPSFRFYRDVENNGIYINMNKYKQVYSDYEDKYLELEKVLKGYADINWDSTKQLSEYLYKDCMMPVMGKTAKGAPSTDADTLQRLADAGFELATILLEYRFYKQALKMFLIPWWDVIHNSRIYPNFNIDTVRTGRTSSSNPNLQQVPRDINLRSIFTAPKGSLFLEIDHSQLELRVASHIMNERNMIKAYKNDEDLHTKTAEIIVGHAPSKDERTMAKPINFGFLYGMQADSFPDYAYSNYGLKFTKEQGKLFRDGFFKAYPDLMAYYKLQENTCKDPMVGGATTIFGRFRPLPDLFSNNWGTRQYGVRCAINTPTQSAGSDILICGAMEVHEKLKDKGVKVVGTVHDSLLLEVRQDGTEEEIYKEIKEILEHPSLFKEFNIELKVPLKIDGEFCGNEETGTGWGMGH
jgi:DNA polymerase-1